MYAKLAIVLSACIAGYIAQDLLPGEPERGFNFAMDTDLLLFSPLDLSFSCEGRTYGYYADVNNNCQVFHICLPRFAEDEISLIRTDQWSFICGNGTVFDQAFNVCNFPDAAFPCADAPSLWAENGEGVPYGQRDAPALVSSVLARHNSLV